MIDGKRFNITKNIKKNEYGNLTVKGAKDVLEELTLQGYGDFLLIIGYDANFAYTCFSGEININEKHKLVAIQEKLGE